jgi:phosphohistidine phosphatase
VPKRLKTLILLRHAKSSWKDESLEDIERPLNDRGVRATEVIGNYIRKHKIVPDLVISSPATRARQTADLVLKAARLKLQPRFDERIYEASAHRLLEVISQVEDAADRAMLIGHNPGFEELVEELTGEFQRMPTCALACIEFNIEKWNKARPGEGNLKWLVTTKKLKRAE